MTLPPTSPHAIVWCGDTPVLQSPGDRRERGKRKPHLGPMSASQPNSTIRSELRGPQRARGVPGQRWQVGREHCLRHETAQNVTIWPFLLAISEIGCTYKKKYHLESGLYQRDEDPHEFSVKQVPMSPRENSLSGGVLKVSVLILPCFGHFGWPLNG